MQLYGACRGQPLNIDARAQVGRNIVQHQLDQGWQIGFAGGAGLAACSQNRAGGQGVVQCAYHLLQHMLGAQQGPGGGRGIGQMQIFDGLERGLHGSRGIVQRLADFMGEQLQHLVVFAQHGRAPVQQGTQPVELARVLAAAAQLLVQGLQLLALACNDFATRIFASCVAELHQHLVPALGIGGSRRELYAAVALRTEVAAAGVVVLLAQTPSGGGEALAMGVPDAGRQQTPQRLADGACALGHIQPLAPGGSGHEQQPFGIPERAALAGAAQQIGQLGGRNG